MASKEILVPDLGDFKDVAVIDVLVKPGDSVQVDTPLLTVETEKATMDVPSPDAGVIEKLHVAKGSKVSSGTLIATLRLGAGAGGAADASESAAPAAAAKTPAAAKAAVPPATSAPGTAKPAPVVAPAVAPPAVAPPAVPAPAASPPATAPASAPVSDARFAGAHAGPSVRRFARELGVDLGRVKGTGQKGRITDADVKAFVKSLMGPGAGLAAAGAAGGAALPKVTVPDFAQFGPIDVKPIGRVQRISGARLHASWVNLPHVTQFDEADITELEQTRAALKDRAQAAGVKLTPLAFIMRACVKALQEFPRFNSALDAGGANLIVRKFINVGFAADTPNGLVVPVVRDAHRKDVYELARHLGVLAEKARAGKVPPADMQGGCFTISSLGGIGGTAFTPIINAPEVAILGVSRSAMRPVFRDGAFVPRLILPLSLSYDHRVIDGAMAARFTTYLAQTLADPRGLLEAVL